MAVKLAAIFNAWADCTDLLAKSVANISPVVDLVIVVWSERSNRGEDRPFLFSSDDPKVVMIRVEPMKHLAAAKNETMRRNAGLDYARASLCTHFLVMDADEFYVQEDVTREKVRIEQENLNGLVCGLRVYIKEPTLWCEDHTLVPFIQKMTPEVTLGDYRHYPFAYDKDRQCHIDPTRRPSHAIRIGWSNVVMHHFSYVRFDMDLKIRNSSANLERSREVIENEMREARPGWMSLLYHRELKECKDLFNIKGAGNPNEPDPLSNV